MSLTGQLDSNALGTSETHNRPLFLSPLVPNESSTPASLSSSSSSPSSSSSSGSGESAAEYVHDSWPVMPNGHKYNGKDLLKLIQEHQNPFENSFDVNILFAEVEQQLQTTVLDIPYVTRGVNNYGFELTLYDHPPVIARLGRADAVHADYDGCCFEEQVLKVRFEAAIHNILQSQIDIPISRLLYHRIPIKQESLEGQSPSNILGRRLFVFEKPTGRVDLWYTISTAGQEQLIAQAAVVRASLFKFAPPSAFIDEWYFSRLFDDLPLEPSIPLEPTRDCLLSVLTAKIHATFGKLESDLVSSSDNSTLCQILTATKLKILQLLPRILPLDTTSDSLYHFVLEHGDFGFHNMLIDPAGPGAPKITSLFDWELGYICPAILSSPRIEGHSPTEQDRYDRALFSAAPEYVRIMKLGKDVRYLWFALRDWKGHNPDELLETLDTWADRLHQEWNSMP